jgi:hypothetical protein
MKKTPLKRDQALNDATHGQFGEQPRPEPFPDGRDDVPDKSSNDIVKDRINAARKRSRSD